jgi:GTP-binding protein
VGDSIICIGGKETKKGKVTKIFSKKGLQKVPINTASAGDIVSIAGIVGASINDTLCASSVKVPLEFAKIDQPTISINIYANDSPLAGKEGKMLTSQAIKDRLLKELETNVSLQLVEHSDSFELKGRGELQIGVLVETLRREGFELSISPPKVLYKSDPEAPKIRLEPIEEVIIEVSSKYAGVVIEKLTKYKAEMKSYTESDDMAHLSFEVPTRGLLGYPAEFKNDTHGQGVLNHCFKGYDAYKGDIEKVRKGSLISMAGYVII